jgi:hypothetical protein
MRPPETPWRLGLVFAAIVALGVGWGAAGADDRHSGTVLRVDAPARIVVVEELGVAGVRRELRVRVAPDARIVMSERVNDTTVTSPPFRDTPMALETLRPGDFVVVEAAPAEGVQVARAVTVTLRGVAADARR